MKAAWLPELLEAAVPARPPLPFIPWSIRADLGLVSHPHSIRSDSFVRLVFAF